MKVGSHTAELTSLNVNISNLCTDRDTSEAPCWLCVCLANACVNSGVCFRSLDLNVQFCQKMWFG